MAFCVVVVVVSGGGRRRRWFFLIRERGCFGLVAARNNVTVCLEQIPHSVQFITIGIFIYIFMKQASLHLLPRCRAQKSKKSNQGKETKQTSGGRITNVDSLKQSFLLFTYFSEQA